jgi:pimeloyl-ACP methyl ester carboxylesterase
MRKAGPEWMRAMWWMGAHLPSLFRFYLRFAMPNSAPNVAAIEKRLRRSSAHLSEADQKLFHTPEIREGFARALAESRHQGAKGNRDEAAMLIRPWGFKIEEITGTQILVWHGEADRVMSVAPARLLAQTLPHCTATFYPDEGHFSILVNHAQEIWKALS